MGLFDYLNIADEGDDNASSFNDDDHNNMDFGKLFKEKGVFGTLEGLNKDREKAYEDEVKNTKFEKARSFFGSLATLGGQMIASGMGARQFNPIQDQVPQYNERLQRLRDAKRADDAQYADKSLSAIFKDYDNKQKENQFNQRMENEARQQEWNENKFKEDLEYKAGRDKAGDKYRTDTLGETKRHNAETERVSATRTTVKEDYVSVYDEEGGLKKIPARLLTYRDYWRYAKNALVRDGKIKDTASQQEVHQAMKNRGVYINPVLKELNSKVGSRLFPRDGTTDVESTPTSNTGSEFDKNKYKVATDPRLDE